MSKVCFEIEIPQGLYTKDELNNLIKNEVSKIVDTPINAYSSTGEVFKIPFEKVFCDNGGEQEELKKRVKEMEKQKEEEEKEQEELKKIIKEMEKQKEKEKEEREKKEKERVPLHFLPEEQNIEDDFLKDMDLLNELFEEKARHIKKNLELLKKLNVISDKK